MRDRSSTPRGPEPQRPLLGMVALLAALASPGLAQGADGVLRGAVEDPHRQRVAGAALELRLAGGDLVEGVSDANGAFELDGVPPGSHRLRVTATGFSPREVEVQIDSSRVTRRTVSLELVGISSQLTVIAPSPDGYEAPRAAAATRLNLPILDTPVSVQVVPSRVLEDQNALGLEEAYTNVSGITQAGNTLNAQSEVRPMIRGFEAAVPLRNGLRATTVGAVDPVNIESVEVLKGPASILYGALEPGGVLNYTTKKPLMAPRYAFSQQLGSEQHLRTTLDATGPLNGSRTVAYRVNAAYQDAASFRDGVELDRVAFVPSLTFRPDERTELFVDFSYSRERVPYDSGVPFGLDGGPLVPPSTFFGDTDLDGRRLDDWFSSVSFFRQLSSNVTFRTQLQFHRVDGLNESIRHRGVRGGPGDEVVRRRYQNEDRTDDDYQLVADVITTFELGGTRHEALVGFDLAYQDSDFRRFRTNLPDLEITADPLVDFQPPADQPLQVILGTNRWGAFYVQDQISMLEGGRLKVLAGARFDTSRGEGERDGVEQEATDAEKLTGRFGAGYKLTGNLLAFASVSQSFLPQSPGTVDASGTLLDPQTGLQYEGGVKLELFGGRFLSTLSAYHIRKANVPLFDAELFNETGAIVYFPGVAERSRGLEVDLAGRLADWLSVVANYAYNDAETVENQADPSQVGRRLGNTPAHLARLWAAVEPAAGPLQGAGLGLGLRAQGAQLAQFDDLELDSYAIVDVALWYRHTLGSGRRLRLQLNVDNLLDEEHYVRASDRSIVHPGDPLTVIGSVGLEF